jgi:hypothetical protein
LLAMDHGLGQGWLKDTTESQSQLLMLLVTTLGQCYTHGMLVGSSLQII